MKGKISFSLIIISCYIFFVVYGINRLSKDKFVLGIYLLFLYFCVVLYPYLHILRLRLIINNQI